MRHNRVTVVRCGVPSKRAVFRRTRYVFSDARAIRQLATVTGSVRRGFVANLTIGI